MSAMSIACTVFNFGVDAGAGAGGAGGATDGADAGGAGGAFSVVVVDFVRREVGGPVRVRMDSSAGFCLAEGAELVAAAAVRVVG